MNVSTVDLNDRISNTFEVSKTVSCIESTLAIPVGILGWDVPVGGLRLLGIVGGLRLLGLVGGLRLLGLRAGQGGRGKEEDGEDSLKEIKFVIGQILGSS